MLGSMRKGAQGIMAKALFILIILSFAIWGVTDYISSSATAPLAEVNGLAISYGEFAQAYDNDVNRMRTVLGEGISQEALEQLGVKQATLSKLLNRYIIYTHGRKLGLVAAPEALKQNIAATPAFQSNGKFDMERYQQTLRGSRLSPAQYEAQLAFDLVSEQLQLALRGASAPPPQLVLGAYLAAHEQRTAQLFAMDPKQVAATLTPTPAELEGHLKQNQDRFTTPVRVKLQYAVLDSSSVWEGITVPPEEIAAYYQEHIAEYGQEETRRVRHILAEAKDDTPQEEGRALGRIVAAQKELAAGKPFAEVAKNLSDDPATAEQGGDLGAIQRGIMPEPFDNAVFSLAAGVVSAPVRTDFGYHLIQVDEIVPARTKPLEEASPEIVKSLTAEKAQDDVYKRSTVFEDQANASSDLAAIAKDLNLRYKELGPFTREETAKLEDLEKHPKFLETAFATPQGKNSTLVDFEDGRFVVIHVTAREESRPRTLAEAPTQVEADYRQTKALAQVRTQLTKLMEELKTGKPVAELLKAHPEVTSTTTPPFTVQGAPEVPKNLVSEIFARTLAQPVVPQLLEGELIQVALLTAIQPADPAGLIAVEKELQPAMKEALEQDLFYAYLKGLQQTARVNVNEEMLKR